MSGGEKQRVAVARALVHKPSLVLADEPTASLDSENGMKVIDLLREATPDTDRVVLIATHDTRILNAAHRVIRMEDGTVVGDSPT